MVEFITHFIAFVIVLCTKAISHWLGLTCFVLAYFFLEFMEHSRDNHWNPDLKIFNWKIGKWLNSKTAFTNKDDFGGDSSFWDFVFRTILVFLTDGEHLFQFLMFAFIGLGVGEFTNSNELGWLAFLAIGFIGGGVKTTLKIVFPKKFKIR